MALTIINRSKIQFPYRDLETGISVAKVIANARVALTKAQLATSLHIGPESGNFSVFVGTARTFGLVAYDHKLGTYAVTDLGSAIVDRDEQKWRPARARAFLHVPLYKAIYEDRRGKPLPPFPRDLEELMIQLGVSPKQGEAARLAFIKSARQAGFLTDDEKLIEPNFGTLSATLGELSVVATGTVEEPSVEPKTVTAVGRAGTKWGMLHPALQGLLNALPPEGSEWPMDKRVAWLNAAASIFGLMYTTSESISDFKIAYPVALQARSGPR